MLREWDEFELRIGAGAISNKTFEDYVTFLKITDFDLVTSYRLNHALMEIVVMAIIHCSKGTRNLSRTIRN